MGVGNYFLQVLEGDEDVVENLLRKIGERSTSYGFWKFCSGAQWKNEFLVAGAWVAFRLTAQ